MFYNEVITNNNHELNNTTLVNSWSHLQLLKSGKIDRHRQRDVMKDRNSLRNVL